MGTGIVSILLHNLPYNGRWLYWISVIIFCLNVALFITFLCISILRYTLYPAIWKAMIRHPVQSLFLGTFPMGFATIVNMVVFVCVPAWGYRAIQLVSESHLDERHSELSIAGLGSLVDRRGNFLGGLSLSPLRNVRLSSNSGRSNADHIPTACIFTQPNSNP
jgi:hypothetical protein